MGQKQSFRFRADSELDGFEPVNMGDINITLEIGGKYFEDMSVDEAIGYFVSGAISGLNMFSANKATATPKNIDPFSGNSHGLEKPKHETEEARQERFNAEGARQCGYNDGLRGQGINPHGLENEYYMRGYRSGEKDNSQYCAGYGDGVTNLPIAADQTDPAYHIGYHEGAASRH